MQSIIFWRTFSFKCGERTAKNDTIITYRLYFFNLPVDISRSHNMHEIRFLCFITIFCMGFNASAYRGLLLENISFANFALGNTFFKQSNLSYPFFSIISCNVDLRRSSSRKRVYRVDPHT